MTPLDVPPVDADGWRLVCIIGVGSWLAVDPSPLWTWPYYAWILLGMAAVGVYCELGGGVEGYEPTDETDEVEE